MENLYSTTIPDKIPYSLILLNISKFIFHSFPDFILNFTDISWSPTLSFIIFLLLMCSFYRTSTTLTLCYNTIPLDILPYNSLSPLILYFVFYIYHHLSYASVLFYILENTSHWHILLEPTPTMLTYSSRTNSNYTNFHYSNPLNFS